VKLKSWIFILALLVLSASQMAYAGAAKAGRNILSTSTVTVGTVTGSRSGRVTVPITFQGDGETTEFTADISFPLGNISLVNTNGVVPVGGATCARISDTLVRVSIAAATPLPSNIRYCDIRFNIGDTATGGSVPLTVSNAVCTDSQGAPLSCQTVSGAVRISGLQTSLADGTNIVIAGYEGTVQETRRVRITNLGLNPLSVSCALNPVVAGLSLTTAPNIIPPGQNQDAVITCALPVLGTPDRLSSLSCTTTDPVRPLLRYSVTCTTVAVGQPLPRDQLLDNDLDAGDQLGAAAAQSAIAGTGTQVVALGAPFAGVQNGGRVKIFEGDTQASQLAPDGVLLPAKNVLSPAAVLGSAELRNGDKFGAAVLMSADGGRIAVGAPKAGPNGNQLNGKGAVFVYDRPVNGWRTFDSDSATLVFQINAPLPNGSLIPDEFGSALAFAPNGDLVIGAPGTDAGGIVDAGRVFRYRISGATVNPVPDFLISSAPVTAGRFGAALAMSGSLLVVGAPGEGTIPTPKGGSAYSVRDLANSFGPPAAFPNSRLQADGNCGSSVAIKGDVIVVGCPGINTMGLNSGAVLLYRPSPGGAIIEQTILLPATGANQGSGTSVATNGDLVIVGAPDKSDGSGGSGSVYVYQVKPGVVAPQAPMQKIIGIGARSGDNYGKAVSMNSQQAIVGSPLYDVVLSNNSSILDVGQGDPFVLDAIQRDGFE